MTDIFVYGWNKKTKRKRTNHITTGIALLCDPGGYMLRFVCCVCLLCCAICTMGIWVLSISAGEGGVLGEGLCGVA